MLTNLDNVVRYTVSGNTYAITYPYWSTEEIKAYITLSDGTVSGLTYGTDFTVTAPNGVNGTLTKVSAWTDAEKLTIVREVELTQEIDLINGEKIDGEQLETGLDLKTAGLQQLNEKFTRSVMTSIDETGDNMVIPNSTARKGTGDGTLLGFDGTGGNIVLRDLKQFDADVANTATNASAASASATLAQKWAENPEDTPVVTGSYSALHHANKAKASATSASTDATTATNKALDSEAYAIGKRNGVDVPNTDPAYHNNTKYYYDLVVGAISGALRYQGTWTTTGATDYSAIPTPRVKGDLYYCQGTACTIDGVTYTQGDLIIFNQDVASTITTSAIDKIDNTETVTPDNTCTLENKTIPLGDNDITTTADKVIVSDASGNIGAGPVDASKIVSTDGTQTLTNKTIAYDDNTLTGVQPTLTAGTGLAITGTTISSRAAGSFSALVNSHDITSSNPLSTTISSDGILWITSAKTGSGYSATISLNDVTCGGIFFGDGITVAPQTCIVQIPVKSGDVLKITADLPASSPQTWRIRVGLMGYRN